MKRGLLVRGNDDRLRGIQVNACPRCGGQPEAESSIGQHDPLDQAARIGCRPCGIFTQGRPDVAVKRWNELSDPKAPPPLLDRGLVYSAFDAERTYQDERWSNDQVAAGTHEHSPAEWLVYIQDYLTEALHAASRLDDQVANPQVMHGLRKIGAMCVAAMEQCGVYRRDGSWINRRAS